MTGRKLSGKGFTPVFAVAFILLLSVALSFPVAGALEDARAGMRDDGSGGMPEDGPDGTGGSQEGVGINDIVLTDITFSGEEPMEGDVITIGVTVSNEGTVTATNITIMFLEGEVGDNDHGPGDAEDEESGDALAGMNVIGTIGGITLEPGSSVTISAEWTAEKYDHTISVVRVVDGTPLTNTLVSQVITVTAEPMGDVPFLVWTLAAIFISILAVAIVPSVYNCAVNGKKGE